MQISLSSSIWQKTWPWIVVLLSPFLWLIRQFLAFVLWIDLRFIHDLKVSDKMKCPSCGNRKKHEIHFAEDFGCVIHICSVCKAQFGSPTVLPIEKWPTKRPITEKEKSFGE